MGDQAQQGGHVTLTSATPTTRKCFNCGKPGCIPSTCNQPHDKEKIKRNAEAYKKPHPKSGTANGGNEQKKQESNGGYRRGKWDDLGHAMMKNKHGTFVVDQQKLQASKTSRKRTDLPDTKKTSLQMMDMLKNIKASLTTSNTTFASSTIMSSAPDVTQQVHEVCSLITALIRE